MKDKNGFTIRCKYTEWKVINEDWDHDFVCGRCIGTLKCYANEGCKYYVPDVKGEKND